MKIKIQQLVEKVRRSPSDNGSFEVQSKLEETEAYCWQMIVHFAFIQLFPPHHFKFRVATKDLFQQSTWEAGGPAQVLGMLPGNAHTHG